MEIDLSIVVLAYNEAENVRAVLGELCDWLRENEPASEIVLVDDGSSDNTAAIARETLADFPSRIVRHRRNRGIGAALKTGVSAARGRWITFMPADGQIDPAAIGTLRGAATEDVDLVLSVYEHRDDGLDRTLLSAGVRTLIWMVHGVRLRSDGPYLFPRALFVPDELPPDTFFLNFELPIRALAAGVRTRTVTIACRPRQRGESKSSGMSRITGVARDLFDLRWRRMRRSIALLRGRT